MAQSEMSPSMRGILSVGNWNIWYVTSGFSRPRTDDPAAINISAARERRMNRNMELFSGRGGGWEIGNDPHRTERDGPPPGPAANRHGLTRFAAEIVRRGDYQRR